MSNTPHTINIEITPNGEVKATVEGIIGPVCGPLSAFLDRLGEVVEDDPTPEFYMPAQIDEQIDTGWGN